MHNKLRTLNFQHTDNNFDIFNSVPDLKPFVLEVCFYFITIHFKSVDNKKALVRKLAQKIQIIGIIKFNKIVSICLKNTPTK